MRSIILLSKYLQSAFKFVSETGTLFVAGKGIHDVTLCTIFDVALRYTM